MSDILNDLNVDKEDFDWHHLSVCSGLDTNLFYDKYEADINIAKSIDQMCLSCPVISICHENGVENDEHGVWGGVYMSSGSVDKARNTHKTQEIWKQLKRKHVYR